MSDTSAKAVTKPKATKKPRYLELADLLRSAVLLGEFGNGQGFPTEAVLCQKYGVSRFTIREALRKLETEGLISRRRGSGTTIHPASARAGALHQPLSNVGEILQYARDTTIRFETLGTVPIPPTVAEQIGIVPESDWLFFRGLRQKEGRKRPIAVTEAWVRPDLAPALADFDHESMTIFGQLQSRADIQIKQITQDIQAIAASEQIAVDLGIETNDPVLRILRSYFDQTDAIFEVSASFHPGERFAYSMHIDVDR